jgi:hypothetical protein
MIPKLLIILMILSLSVPAWADKWVRPVSGEYGLEDGSSYANAYDGISDIVWDDVDSDDGKLFFCGDLSGEGTVTIGSSGEDGTRVQLVSCTAANGCGTEDPGTVASINVGAYDWLNIEDVTVDRSSGDGIYSFGDADNVTIRGVTVQNCAGEGITHYTSTNLAENWIIEDSTVKDNGPGTDIDSGIFFKGTNIIIRRCLVEHNGYGDDQTGFSHGIYIDSGCTPSRIEIYECDIYNNNKGHGIQSKSGGNFHHNRVKGNGVNGIYAGENSANVTTYVWANVIYENGSRGIAFRDFTNGQMDAYIYNNTTYDNGSFELHSNRTLDVFVCKNNSFVTVGADTVYMNTPNSATFENNWHYDTMSAGTHIYYDGSNRTWSYWTSIKLQKLAG